MAELRSNAEWKQWGEEDPLWGVASWAGKEKGGASPWTEEEFYALGVSDWEDFLAHWQQYANIRQSCLEIGCGAGRLTRPIALSFERVYAVDVSEHMVTRARKAVSDFNVEFSIMDGVHLPQSDGSVTAVFSAHVLQHLDNVAAGFAYFREFFRVLDTGGTLMVHLPLYEFPNESGALGTAMKSQYAVYRAFSNIKTNVNRRLRRKSMKGTLYPTQSLYCFLTSVGFKNVQFRIFPLRTNGHLHSFVFATK